MPVWTQVMPSNVLSCLTKSPKPKDIQFTLIYEREQIELRRWNQSIFGIFFTIFA